MTWNCTGWTPLTEYELMDRQERAEWRKAHRLADANRIDPQVISDALLLIDTHEQMLEQQDWMQLTEDLRRG